MAIRNVLLDRFFTSHEEFLWHAKDVQEKEFPWSLSFSIEFLPGHISLVFKALSEFKAIVGEKRLADDSAFFLWANAAHGPTVFMFANGLDRARRTALMERCKELRMEAAYRCKACGRHLDKMFDDFCPPHSRLYRWKVERWYASPSQVSSDGQSSSPSHQESILDSTPAQVEPEESSSEPTALASPEPAKSHAEGGTSADTGPVLEMWHEQSVSLLRSQLPSMDVDSRGRVRGYIDRIASQKSKKPLRMFSGVTQGLFDDLRMLFPNFSSVIDYIEGQCALSLATGRELAFDPILIHGKPGHGKSIFMQHLAAGLNLTPVLLVDMSSAQCGASLSGSEQYWANSSPGQFFWHLVCGEVANPVVVLEEIDKVDHQPGSRNATSPLSALHRLLERHSASRFFDLALPEFHLDVSRVIWLATCNVIERVPDAIRQRFLTFEIPEPDEKQAKHIAISVFTHLRHERGWTHFLDGNLSDEALRILSVIPPREMRKRLTAGAGRALLAGRRSLVAEDLLGLGPLEHGVQLVLH